MACWFQPLSWFHMVSSEGQQALQPLRAFICLPRAWLAAGLVARSARAAAALAAALAAAALAARAARSFASFLAFSSRGFRAFRWALCALGCCWYAICLALAAWFAWG